MNNGQNPSDKECRTSVHALEESQMTSKKSCKSTKRGMDKYEGQSIHSSTKLTTATKYNTQ